MHELLTVKDNLIPPLAFVQRNFGRTGILHLSLIFQITSANRKPTDSPTIFSISWTRAHYKIFLLVFTVMK